jgi:uncharacterized surface protein with fasciclin (FAS1) repeats
VDFTVNQVTLPYSEIMIQTQGVQPMKILMFGTAVALAAAITASSSIRVHAQTQDIVQTAVAAGSFKTLARALEAADLVSTLQGAGPFTVFAPTDEAFAKLPAGTLERLLRPENRAELRRVLTYHVVAGKVMASDAAKLQSAQAVSGDTMRIAAGSNGVTIDGARVVTADIAASNGVIHVIDAVILPSGL